MTLSIPSSYLEASLDRWVARGALIRREADMMLDGLEVKGHFLEGLRVRVQRHRHEDLAQLKTAREDSWAQWEERLRRMEEWTAVTADLGRVSGRLSAWKSGAGWFDRAQGLVERYSAALEKKATVLERRLFGLAEQTRAWSDGLILKEADVRNYSPLDAARSSDIIITSGKKQAFMEFVYAQREKEGRLAREFKNIRGTVNLILERFPRAEKSLADRADKSPGYFEIRKTQVLEAWRPLHARYGQLRESTLHQALAFEEGRTRLRWIYDALQKMRVVEDSSASKKPLLERLFKL